MYDDYSYLIHSAKGSTWSKKDHKYIKKYKSKNGRWVYVYRINKDKSIKLESSTHDAETEALLDNYASRLKTMDINSDGTYLKNGERRIFQGKSIFDDGSSRMVWTSKTNRMDSSYKDVVNDKEKLKKEITGNPSTGLWQNVNAPTKFELNDEMRRDNQKALAKGIKKLRNKKK